MGMEQPHVIVFPYVEQGHVTPAFAFGLALARKGLRVTCMLTATLYAHFSTRVPDACPLFSVEAIPDVHQGDVCSQLPSRKLEPGLEQLLLRIQPRASCLISDILYPWSQDLADRLGIPRYIFCTFSAMAFLLAFRVDALFSNGFLPFKPGMEEEVVDFVKGLPRDFRVADIPVDFLLRNLKDLEVLSLIQRSMKRAAGAVISTVYELEAYAIDVLTEEGWPTYVIGPMGSIDWTGSHIQVPSLFVEDKGCLEWLDTQPRGSVVYVAFGSLVSVTEEEIHELAMGLEASGHPFLWVLRRQRGSNVADPLSVLPAGFQERSKGIGLVIEWAPQAAVLAHPSVGCFLTHCGLGSVFDALWSGVPMVGGFCKLSEQNLNLRLVTKEWGVGIALQDRNVVPPLPLRRAVEMSVKEVLDGERGRALSQKAMHLKGVVRQATKPDGSSYLSLSKLVNVLSSISNSSELRTVA